MRPKERLHEGCAAKPPFLAWRSTTLGILLMLVPLLQWAVLPLKKIMPCLGTALALLATPAAGRTEPAEAITPDAVPGGVYVLPLPAGVHAATYQDRPVLIYQGRALVGININTQPGGQELLLEGPAGVNRHQFPIAPKQYPEEHLTIADNRLVNPSAVDLVRIQAEAGRQRTEYQRFTRRPLDLSPFNQPVDGAVSSLFGQRRVLNGQPRSPHSGLDLAAPSGTPISAPAPAAVMMTGELYFNGKTIFLDHGQGLVTMYCHMNAIAVNEGDEVKRGQVIGAVGATGRATGPHLHWSVSLNANRVDPERIMTILNGR